MASVARLLRRGGCAVRTRLLWEAPKARLGWRRQVASGRGGGGSEVRLRSDVRSPLAFSPCSPPSNVCFKVLEQSRFFRRGVAFSALSYLGYEAYILISHSSVVHADVKVNEVLDQADYLYGSGETEKLYQLLEQYKNSENAQLLWRLARASRDVAQLSQTSAEKKKQLIYEALDYATKALEKEKSCFSVHKKAIELNPKDATSLHLMGIWCYTFADMPWYQSKIAAALFSTPPSSTYEEALRYFQKAEDVEPNFYSKNLLFLGKTYMKLNNRKMALFWLSKAKERLSHTEEDKQNELLLPCCQKRRSLNQENERSRQR
ncbi:regulator of microtubule dynamics protein 1 isoform X4 [Podarcis muralis]